MVFWRTGLFLVGAFFMAAAAACVLTTVHSAGIARLHLALHALFFVAMGTSMLLVALLSKGEMVKSLFKGFLSDMFSRQNLVEIAVFLAIVVRGVASVLVYHDFHN